jgi:hypothetical protein
MNSNIKKLAYEWVTSEPDKVSVGNDYYCQTRDVFQAKLGRMTNDLLKSNQIEENKVYIASAVAGEIGNNSFDHNLGSWSDIAGIFFAYGFYKDKFRIVLADRGQGILKTLKRVKPELKDDLEALEIAFTERISARAPESRGNGLKFSKESVEKENMQLVFVSGRARAELNKKMEIKSEKESINGCLAVLTL